MSECSHHYTALLIGSKYINCNAPCLFHWSGYGLCKFADEIYLIFKLSTKFCWYSVIRKGDKLLGQFESLIKPHSQLKKTETLPSLIIYVIEINWSEQLLQIGCHLAEFHVSSHTMLNAWSSLSMTTSSYILYTSITMLIFSKILMFSPWPDDSIHFSVTGKYGKKKQ